MQQNERQERMLERIQEDEGLRGDLEDAAATALMNWATARIQAATANPARPDKEVEAEVQAIRAAARAAARSGETAPERVARQAEAILAQRSASAAPSPTPQQTSPTSTPTTTETEQAAPSTAQPCSARTFRRRNRRLARLIKCLRGEH